VISEKIAAALDEAEGRPMSPREDVVTKIMVSGLNRASQLGWVQDCPRHLCLLRLAPDKDKGFDDTMKRRLREGNKQEALMRADLTAAGIKIVHHGRLTWEALELTGESDDSVVFDDEYPIDYKTCSSAMFKRIERAQSYGDLIRSPFIWIRHYPAQMQAYMLMLQKRLSVLFFKDKEGGARYLMDVELDQKYASFLIEGIRYINDCVKKEDPPKAEMKEACDACGFADHCFPGVERGASAGNLEIVTEETWLMKLKEYQILIDRGVQQTAKEFDKLDKEIKEEFRGRRVLCGSHLIESKPYFVPFYDVPKEEKEKYLKQREQFRTSIKLAAQAL